MDGNFKPFDYVSSSERIKSIVGQPSGAFEEATALPDRDKLSFTNGFMARAPRSSSTSVDLPP